MIWVNNDMLAAETSHTELFSSHTGKANSFPNFRNIGFLCSIESSLVLLKLNVGLG